MNWIRFVYLVVHYFCFIAGWLSVTLIWVPLVMVLMRTTFDIQIIRCIYFILFAYTVCAVCSMYRGITEQKMNWRKMIYVNKEINSRKLKLQCDFKQMVSQVLELDWPKTNENPIKYIVYCINNKYVHCAYGCLDVE